MKSMTVKEYIRKKALGLLGLIDSSIDPRVRDERLTFVNNIDEVQKQRLQEYNVWYAGDADGLLNYYTRAQSIDYNTDPLYNRNKKSYFWAVSSTESDIKRTHSGQPRNIVDTLVNIIGVPKIGASLTEIDKKLYKILRDNNFEKLLIQKSRPLTFVEGWGAWKINWDTNFRDTPILIYYRADAVDFIFKSNQLVAIIYKDYYQDEKGHNYVLFETRRTERRETVDSNTGLKRRNSCLIIEKELFKINGDSQVLTPIKLKSLPQLCDTEANIIIENYSGFLGYPCIIYEDNYEDNYGRSIFTGKIDLFDDLDQCHSQSSNAVRRSTVHEYFDVQYLERDEKTGMPIMPKVYDRKYIAYKGGKGADGSMAGSPVQVTQPHVDFTQYGAEETTILLNIISGIMSPATLGIDIAKKDNAEAQREKEKVTIFTRNTVIAEESKALEIIANELLIADELMRTGEITCRDYSVNVKYDEFADSSFESKLETVLAGWQSGIMSDEMALRMLYKDSVSEEVFKKELDFLKKNREMEEQAASGGGMNPEEMGMFGDLGAENEFNTEHSRPKTTGGGF